MDGRWENERLRIGIIANSAIEENLRYLEIEESGELNPARKLEHSSLTVIAKDRK